jgi:methyltransferase (TIGR00027 family)
MQSGMPSQTALAAAAHRAAHQLFEQGCIFSDPLALSILGPSGERVARESAENPLSHGMRLFVAARTRFADDALTAALASGVRQLVVLGAGLDTSAYRLRSWDGLRIFEVDHPASQAFKRTMLARVGIVAPDALSFVSVDFAKNRLAEKLSAAGFKSSDQSFFTWLGVVPYLTEDAVWSTLGLIAALSARARVVFDYSEPPEKLGREARAIYDARAQRVAALGEPWLSSFEPERLHARLTALGFRDIEDATGAVLVRRYLPGSEGPSRSGVGHVLYAATHER